jgi:hypothetical protein
MDYIAGLIVSAHNGRVKTLEIIADNLNRAGGFWPAASAIDSNGRTIWIADAHRGEGKRFIVRADEKLTAVVGLESVILEGALAAVPTPHGNHRLR